MISFFVPTFVNVGEWSGGGWFRHDKAKKKTASTEIPAMMFFLDSNNDFVETTILGVRGDASRTGGRFVSPVPSGLLGGLVPGSGLNGASICTPADGAGGVATVVPCAPPEVLADLDRATD